MYKFQKLTPNQNVDLKVYKEALDFAFNDPDIKNIAISGSYSAGKSSIIETYEKKHLKKKFLHISLAHFEDMNNSNDSEPMSESVLEGKILNQLIHQIEVENIPQTNFKVKQDISSKIIGLHTVQILIFILSSLYLTSYNTWEQFIIEFKNGIIKQLLLYTTNKEFTLLVGGIWVGTLALFIYYVVNMQKNKKLFRKLSVQGNEIEIFEDNEESYFDKYLNEVLYLFKNSGADAIVFEDMDRYNMNQIFEKLREINTLINSSITKPIKFLYLLRDDIFISKDRTKFFDFIIPIVPVIDGSNSYDQFIEHFRQGNIFELFDEKFLQEVALYVDDMRILKNIYNEFLIYHSRIQSTELNNNKLLAIIIYKNIFPRDFSNLQLGRGYVHTLFASKELFIKEEISKIQREIDHICELNRRLEVEGLVSIDELDATYLIFDQKNLRVNSKKEGDFKTRAEFIRALKDNPDNIQYSYNSRYGAEWSSFDFASCLSKLNSNQEYVKRKEVVSQNYIGRIRENKIQIEKLRDLQSQIKNRQLRKIITRENVKQIFSIEYIDEVGKKDSFNEIKVSPYFDLIKYLIRNGFIDETYQDYMTYFYENSLSRVDKIFLRSITDQIAKDYTYNLKDPRLILDRLRLIDFDNEEVLNFDLLVYLLQHSGEYTKQLYRFLDQLREKKLTQFISQFLSNGQQVEVFTKYFNIRWSSACEWIITEELFDEKQKKEYIINTLCYSGEDKIIEIGSYNLVREYINTCDSLLDVEGPDIRGIIKGLNLMMIKFQSINYDICNKGLFRAVYENDLYQLNYSLIALMLEYIYEIKDYEAYNTKNYTLVMSMPEEPLAKYVQENINEYINIIVESCNQGINDEEDIALSIINNESIENSSKQRYVELLTTPIHNLIDIEDKEIWDQVLEQRLVINKEKSVLDYFSYSKKGMNEVLVGYINGIEGNRLDFNNKSLLGVYDEQEIEGFFDKVVQCNQLLDNQYEVITESLGLKYIQFEFTGIEPNKISILIRKQIIEMNAENLIFIRTEYSEALMEYILQDMEQYVDVVSNEEIFDMDEVLQILDKPVEESYKIALIEYTNEAIAITNKQYESRIMKHIIENKLILEEIPYLIGIYIQMDQIVRDAIVDMCIKYIELIIEEKYHQIDSALLLQILSSKEVDIDQKKQVLANCLKNIGKGTVKNYLEIMGLEDYRGLFEGKKPKIIINTTNESLLSKFKVNGWIYRFEVDKKYPEYYRVIGKKASNKIPVEML